MNATDRGNPPSRGTLESVPRALIYIGRIRDPAFNWEAAGPEGWSRNFEALYESVASVWDVVKVANACRAGDYPGRQLDWGAWLIEGVPKVELKKFWPMPSMISPAWYRLRKDHPGLTDERILRRTGVRRIRHIDRVLDTTFVVVGVEIW